MTWTEIILAQWESAPKLIILIISLLSSLLIMIIKYYYVQYKETQTILYASKIHLSAFGKVLLASIQNNNKELAKDHYKILLSNSAIFQKNEPLNSIYIKLELYYISLQIDNYANNTQEKETAIEDIEKLIKDLQ